MWREEPTCGKGLRSEFWSLTVTLVDGWLDSVVELFWMPARILQGKKEVGLEQHRRKWRSVYFHSPTHEGHSGGGEPGRRFVAITAACVAAAPQWSCVFIGAGAKVSVEGKNHIWSKSPWKTPEGAAYGLALPPPQPCPKHSWQRPGINFCSNLAWYIGPGSVQEQLLSEAREGRAHGGREPERQWGQRSISAVPGPARSRLEQSLTAAPSPFCPRTQAGPDGSGRQSPIPRPSGVGKVRVYLHGESGPRIPTLMGRRSNQPSSCSGDKSWILVHRQMVGSPTRVRRC